MMAQVLKTILQHCRNMENFKQGRCDIFTFLGRLFCGWMLEEGPDQRQGKQLDNWGAGPVVAVRLRGGDGVHTYLRNEHEEA